jgi:hypothetical protein
MTRKLIALVLGLFMATLLLGAATAQARMRQPGFQALVVKQSCLDNTGGTRVKLSAIAPWSYVGVMFTWDLTTDGRYDTELSASPDVTHTYRLTRTSHATATVTAATFDLVVGSASVTIDPCLWAQPGG